MLFIFNLALLRRGTAYKSKKDYNKAISDFERVLKMEPQNKKAEVNFCFTIVQF